MKLSKIIGITKDEFDTLIENKEIALKQANLIPVTKIGGEIALTSVLLSSLRLIKEFRQKIFEDIGMF